MQKLVDITAITITFSYLRKEAAESKIPHFLMWLQNYLEQHQ